MENQLLNILLDAHNNNAMLNLSDIRAYEDDPSVVCYCRCGNDNIIINDYGHFAMFFVSNAYNPQTNEYDRGEVCIMESFDTVEEAWSALLEQMTIDLCDPE